MSKNTFSVSRRSLLRAGGFMVAGAATLSAPSVLRAAQPMRLTFGHGAAPGNPRSLAAEKFAEVVKAKSNGAIEVFVAGAEQLGNDAAMLTAVRMGTLDITANSQGTTSALVPEMAAFGLPFLFPEVAAAVLLLKGELGKPLAEKFDAVGMVPLDWWDNGIRHITNSKRPINTPEDLAGLKIRTPSDPMTIDIFKALGAATAQIPFSELYIALQQGVVDGQENPLTNIASSKLFEVNKYISLSAHKWESTPVLMSKVAWGRLDQKARDIVNEAVNEASLLQISLVGEATAKLQADFANNPAVALNTIDREAFRKKTASVYDDWQKKPFGDFVKKLRTAAGA